MSFLVGNRSVFLALLGLTAYCCFLTTVCAVTSGERSGNENSKNLVLRTSINTIATGRKSEDNPESKYTRNKQLLSSRASGDVPRDNGGNYGDLVHQQRVDGDVLLIRETVTNWPFNGVQDMVWTGEFITSRLTEVRVLNFGRERGYCYEVSTNNNRGLVEVLIRIPPQHATRMFIEVYGFP